MSEVSPENLVEEMTLTFEDATVVPVPIDPTLTISGNAADAKATGDRIAAAINKLRVNAKGPVSNIILLYASDIPMSGDPGANTVQEAIEAASNRDANNIYYDATNLVTVKGAIDSIKTEIDTELTSEEIDEIFDEVFGGDD